MTEPDHLVIILICLVFSAFFSGMEIAFVSADKLRIKLNSDGNSLIGRVLLIFHKNGPRFLATTLIGNNLALVIYGIFMAQMIEPWILSVLPVGLAQDVLVLAIQTIVATFVVLVTAEFVPKSIFLLNPNFMLSLFAIPMALIYWIMYPVVSIVEAVSKFIIVKILGYDYSEDQPVYRLTDLNNYIKKHFQDDEEKESDIDVKIFNNALEFKEIKVRECMRPRTEIVAVEVNDDMEDLKNAFIESGHSKIVVYKENIDEVIGYCHSLEMFKKPSSIKKILTPITIVPEATLANELLIQFINERRSLALVVDEFGGTSGIVTMEDVMEEIFGEIQDEHDELLFDEKEIEEGVYLLNGRHEIDYLNDKYRLELPEGDYDTLGGLILLVYEDIPSEGETINWNHYHFEILTMEENRIDKVQLTISEDEESL